MAAAGTYVASVLPTADTPAWTKTQSVAPTTEVISSGQLHLVTANGETCYYTITDAGVNYTLAHLRMDLKWVSGDVGSSGQAPTFYAQLIVGGKCAGQIGVRNDGTISYGYHNGTTWTYVDYNVNSTSDAMHSYEVEWVNGTLYFKFDGEVIASYSGTHYTAATSTTYRFGDGSGNLTLASEAYIDNVDYFGGTLATASVTSDATLRGTVTKTLTSDAVLEPIAARLWRYEFPITVAGATAGSIITATVPDWTDTAANLRALSSGDDVRVFTADGATEFARDFSSGVVKWSAPDSATDYLIRIGRSDAGPPRTAGVGSATVTATVGTRRTTSINTSTSESVAMTTAGDASVANYGAAATTGAENAQAFTPSASGNLAKVGLWLKAQTDARPGDTDYSEWVTVRVETDNGGKPSGTVVGQLRVPYAVIKKNTAGYGEVVFHNRSTTYLDAARTYWLVLSVSKNTSSNSVQWDQDTTSPTYTLGTSARARSAGAWGAWSSADASKSFRFRVTTGFIGAPRLPDVSITSERKPFILPSALPSWAEQTPTVYGINARIEDGGDAYLAMWSSEDSANAALSPFAVKQSDRSVSTTTKMLDGTGSPIVQKRISAWWKNAVSDFRAIATFFAQSGPTPYRRLHYATGTDPMNTAYSDGGEVTIDVTDPLEHKFATRNIIGGQTYLYFDVSLTATLYNTDFVRQAKSVRAKYDGTTGLTDFEYVEFDLDGVQGDVAFAWVYNITRNGVENYVAFIFAQWPSDNYYRGNIYVARSNDGVFFGPAKPLFTDPGETTLSASASAGASTVTVTSVAAANLAINDYVHIQGDSPSGNLHAELRKITNIVGVTGAVVTLDSALTYAHGSGCKIARVDANQPIVYSADLSTPSAAKLWGYATPGIPWRLDLDTTFLATYPLQFSGDLSQLLSPTADVTSDAVLSVTRTANVPSDSLLVTQRTTSTTSDASLRLTTKTVTSDAVLAARVTANVTSDAVLGSTRTLAITSNAVLTTSTVTRTVSVSSNARLGTLGSNPYIVSPTHLSSTQFGSASMSSAQFGSSGITPSTQQPIS